MRGRVDRFRQGEDVLQPLVDGFRRYTLLGEDALASARPTGTHLCIKVHMLVRV